MPRLFISKIKAKIIGFFTGEKLEFDPKPSKKTTRTPKINQDFYGTIKLVGKDPRLPITEKTDDVT